MEFVMHSGKKCFFDEEACLEDFNFVLTLEINMKPPVKKYFEEFANKVRYFKHIVAYFLFKAYKSGKV